MTKPDITERPPLADEAAERALIGSIATHYRQWPKIAGLVSGSDFTLATYGRAFDAIVALAQAGEPIHSTEFLFAQLRSMGIESVELFRAIREGFHPEVSPYFAERIHRLSNLRKIESFALKALADCGDPNAVDGDVANDLRKSVESLTAGNPQPAESVGAIAERVINRLRKPAEHIAGKSLMTGIFSLDNLAGAIRPGELVIIAARPGCGKTSLAMQIAEHNAERARRCLFVSLEMTGDELTTRMLAAQANVASSIIRSEQLEPVDVDALGAAAVGMADKPLQIWAPAKAKMLGIEATAKITAIQPGGLALVIVDYIGLVEPDSRRMERHEQVAIISQSLKRMAKELAVPVIALCQLNREAEKEVPKLSHLRESGAIEQDADMVWFIHFTEGRNKTDSDNLVSADLLIAKHRHGSTGRIELKFNPTLTRFQEPSREWRPSAY